MINITWYVIAAMLDYLLLLLLVAPFIAAGAIAFNHSQSFFALPVVLLGAIGGAALITLAGIYWLQVFHRCWMESQAAGFIFLPITLPFCVYIGAVAGASLVAILYGQQRSDLPSPAFQMIAIGFTVVLGGLIPSAIVAIPSFSTSSEGGKFAVVPLFMIFAGVASSWLASKLAYLLVAGF